MNKNNIIINSPKYINKNPYYLKDIKEDVLLTLGLNLTNIGKIYSYIKNKNINTYKNFLENELNLIYNIYVTCNNNQNLELYINEHISNLNEYTNYILKNIDY